MYSPDCNCFSLESIHPSQTPRRTFRPTSSTSCPSHLKPTKPIHRHSATTLNPEDANSFLLHLQLTWISYTAPTYHTFTTLTNISLPDVLPPVLPPNSVGDDLCNDSDSLEQRLPGTATPSDDFPAIPTPCNNQNISHGGCIHYPDLISAKR